jgi:hypothetical protein
LLDLAHQSPERELLVIAEVYLLTLPVEIEKVDVRLMLKIKEQVAKAAALSLSSEWVYGPGFADTAEARHHVSALRIFEEFILDRIQNGVGLLLGSAAKLTSEDPRFDEYHQVILTHSGT